MPYNIQRYKTTLTIDFSENDTTIVSGALPSDSGESLPRTFNGLLRGILLNVPDLNGTTPTLTITIKDADGFTVYTKASIAENGLTSVFLDAQNNPLNIPLSGKHTITLVTSEAQTEDQDIDVVLLIDR